MRTIFAQERPEDAWRQLGDVVAKLTDAKLDAAAQLLSDAAPDVLAYTAFPKDVWKKIWSNNPQERLNKEIRRRTDVVGIFPNRAAVIAWSAPSSPSSTTNGPSRGATSAATRSVAAN